MVVRSKSSSDPAVIQLVTTNDLLPRLRREIRGRFLSRSRRKLEARPPGASFFSEDRSELGADILQQLPGQDVLNLHWVTALFDYQEFFRHLPPDLPLVWTLHDMNAFTGGCHFDDGCGKFQTQCGACPQLGSSDANDFSAKCWHRKETALEHIPKDRLHIVTPSRWLAGEAQKSAILGKYPVSVIPNGLDTEIFQPRDKQLARQAFGIPANAKVILFVADSTEEKRKGFHKLLQAVEDLQGVEDAFLLCLGRGMESASSKIPSKNLGYIQKEEKLSQAYSAADIFVAPSLQDNLPNTILEAFGCGIPVVAFAVGGCVELVREGQTGVLARAGDHEHLRAAIVSLLTDTDLPAKMSRVCRQVAIENYSLKIQAARYELLYESLISASAAPH